LTQTLVTLQKVPFASVQLQVEPPQVALLGQVLVPAHAPAEQTSLLVQLFPSSQLAVLLLWLHCPEPHASVVQGLRSSQS
jgi:hypothetical protein